MSSLFLWFFQKTWSTSGMYHNCHISYHLDKVKTQKNIFYLKAFLDKIRAQREVGLPLKLRNGISGYSLCISKSLSILP